MRCWLVPTHLECRRHSLFRLRGDIRRPVRREQDAIGQIDSRPNLNLTARHRRRPAVGPQDGFDQMSGLPSSALRCRSRYPHCRWETGTYPDAKGKVRTIAPFSTSVSDVNPSL